MAWCCCTSDDLEEHQTIPQVALPAKSHFTDEDIALPNAKGPLISTPTTTARSTASSDFQRSDLVEKPEKTVQGGALYTGQWMGEHMHGQGSLKRSNGQVFTGNFEFSCAHAYGVWSDPTGASYEGQWERNLKHGSGRYVHADGTTYDGEWHHDTKSGTGTEIWADGASYTGQFLSGCKHGHGKYVYSDKQGKECSYDGQWCNDQMEGEGIYHFADGRCYRGQWQGGRMTGQGTIDFPDEESEEGSDGSHDDFEQTESQASPRGSSQPRHQEFVAPEHSDGAASSEGPPVPEDFDDA